MAGVGASRAGPVAVPSPTERHGIEPQPVRPVVLARQHGEHALRRARGGGVDRRDPGVGMGRAQDDPVRHPRQYEIVDIAAAPGEEAPVLAARDRLADAVIHALFLLCPRCPVAGRRR